MLSRSRVAGVAARSPPRMGVAVHRARPHDPCRPQPAVFWAQARVTWCNLASDQFTGLDGETVPGTFRDRLYLLAAVLEHETELQPTEIMTDTGRLHRHDLRHLPPPRGPVQPAHRRHRRRAVLAGRSRGRLRHPRRTRRQPDQHQAHHRALGRSAAARWSLKLGVVRAAGLTRVLQTNDRPTRLARALQELGRLVKSLYLLRFIVND